MQHVMCLYVLGHEYGGQDYNWDRRNQDQPDDREQLCGLVWETKSWGLG